MKYLFTLLLLCAISFSFISVDGSDPTLKPFNAIKLEGNATVHLVPGNSFGVQYADEGDKKSLDIHHSDKTLVVSGTGEVYVSLKQNSLVAIMLEGSGDILCDKTLRSDDLAIELKGSGDINLERLNANELNVQLTGSGDIFLAGSAEEANYNLQGSGDIKAAGLKATDVSASILGSGDVSLHASETLEARIHGSGDIHYDGNPQLTHAESLGNGKLVEL
ncbi:MAG: head GIN domain-containing protein [Bacteroidia bacterium]